MNYKPKYFNAIKVVLVRDEDKNKTLFVFRNKDNQPLLVQVDESIERIKSRMNDVLSGERDAIYLTNGMMNINIDRTIEGRWQLWDEFDVYEFDLDVN